ncbi:prephenate dehydratase [Vagococcus acidifermentans]|uniref:Prephenate dehydratase n=1 Tax=Vagococcus acidifermentans TaxID=564710 RepID=A0A430AML4_9ENTE|nr:prephenate dehydratase [Vagococcus acidifermentans]RSU09306.1 prephenate dehydratase [Vagococcus acidifermentans]
MKIGYLGPSGSFTQMATQQLFPDDELLPHSTIPSCLKAVMNGEVDVSVVPIENTIEGTVNPTLDFMYHQFNGHIQGEAIMQISQQLMVHPDNAAGWRQVDRILSHPQALAQCQEFISDTFPDKLTEATFSTAYAAKYVKENRGQAIAAIAPKRAADEYGLTIVKENIQDISQNETRFWVASLAPFNAYTKNLTSQGKKVSIAVEMTRNVPGGLHKILSALSWRGLDLSKIESRPLKTRLGEYFFLIDIVNAQELALVQLAIEEITLLGGKVKLLGEYDVFPVSSV